MDILLTWAALSVSFFVTISLFWLGLMVLLAGNRRSAGTWLTGGGLMLGALFFTSHTAILGRGLSSTSFGMDFWWWVSWIPAVIAPLAWYGSMLWYAGCGFRQPHRHHSGLALVVILTVCIALLLVFANPLPSYQHVAGRSLALTPSLAGIPILILAYLVDSLLCYLLPLDLLRRTPVRTLEMQTRNRARPYLIGASLAMLLAGSMLALTALWALRTQPLASLSDLGVVRTVLRFDLAVETLVAAAVTLLGRTIVGYEVFTGRPLPRSRFFLEWRSTLLLAAGFGAVAAWMLVIELRPVYSLMLATALMTLFYALSSWRSFDEREKYMARLRPFIASQNLYEQMTRPGDGPYAIDPSASAYPLFETLCLKVLEVRSAVLQPGGALAAIAGPALFYPSDSLAYLPGPLLRPEQFHSHARCVPVREIGLPDAARQGLEWAVPLWSSRGLDGVLFLGQKTNQNPFTEEEIEIAQTAGERLLDLLAGGEMARLSMDLLRQRLAQTKILEGQGRRVLHDEVLPHLHTALLYLSGSPDPSPEQRQAMAMLTESHQRIAGLMREMPLAAPQRLSQNGLAAALRALVENEYAGRFERVDWEIKEQAEQRAGQLPLFVNEVIYFAARELVRNAAVHGRGEALDYPLCLKLRLEMREDLCLTIEDNGAGFHPRPNITQKAELGGTGSGLRIHSAMLAAVGGRLEVEPVVSGGTRAVIRIAVELR